MMLKRSNQTIIIISIFAALLFANIPLVSAESAPKGLNLVVRGSDNGIYYNIYDTSWNGYVKIPGTTPDTPAAALYNGDLHFILRGSDDRIYHGILDLETNSFGGWSYIGGTTPSSPELTTTANSLIIGVRGSNDKIYYREYTGTWGIWKTVPGTTPVTPAITAIGDTLHFVVKGNDNRMYHCEVDLVTDDFSGWSLMSGTTPSPPKIIDDGEVFYLTVRGSDNGIYYRKYNTTWEAWNKIPGTTTTKVTASIYQGDLQVMVRGESEHKIWWGTTNLITNSFSGWSQVGGTTPDAGALCSYDFDYRLTPQTPTQGQNIIVSVQAEPSTTLPSKIIHTKTVTVTDNTYTWDLTGLTVPFTTDSVTISAETVDDISVTATIDSVPTTQTALDESGVASLIITNVGSGTYDLEIEGTATGQTEVVITVTAIGTVDTDGDGLYTINYDTDNIPVGDFTVKIRNVTRVYNLE